MNLRLILQEIEGTNEGSKLADNADLWNSGNLEDNAEFGTSGFNGLPAGHRLYDNGYYSGMGNFASYWSSTVYSSNTAMEPRTGVPCFSSLPFQRH